MKKQRFFKCMGGLVLIMAGGYFTNYPRYMILAILCILVGYYIYYSQL